MFNQGQSSIIGSCLCHVERPTKKELNILLDEIQPKIWRRFSGGQVSKFLLHKTASLTVLISIVFFVLFKGFVPFVCSGPDEITAQRESAHCSAVWPATFRIFVSVSP